MPVITMNVPCEIRKKSKTDVYGEMIMGALQKSKCAIIKLVKTTQHTTVRADSGATRGHADETVADAILLLDKKVEPEINSTILVRGVSLRVTSVRHRMNVMSQIDHYEVRCSIE